MEGGFLSLEASSGKKTYTQVFEEAFPYYLHIGMDADMYWHGDASLCKWYRQKHELDRQEQNQMLWLMGRYVYDAIGALAPALNGAFAFSKEHIDVGEYVKEPYALTTEEQDRREKEEFERQKEEALRKIRSWVSASNKKRGGENNG